MLALLCGKVTERKLRLFACACCRRIWHLVNEQRCRRAVVMAERYADGSLSAAELKAVADAAGEAQREAYDATVEGVSVGARYHASFIASYAYAAALSGTWNFGPTDAPYSRYREALNVGGAYAAAVKAAANSGVAAANAAQVELGIDGLLAEVAEKVGQCSVLRDIFGNPFRIAAIDSSHLTPAAVALARLAYEELAFDRLPILGDALEDAGCADAAILEHCHGPGPHARGCWVLDLILGRS
jgi:hypothetical protein